ncbi:MAG TPA: AtpZ/AtpI family protein [Flavobacteriales bacterium]|nr:AtpZ/AtpI family protein [Flavobacteriales bacterium]
MTGPEKEGRKLRKAAHTYARLSGIGFQMAAIIGLGTYSGWRADQWTAWKFPLFTLLGALGGVAMAIYILFKETRQG